jgi:hypothetical protein
METGWMIEKRSLPPEWWNGRPKREGIKCWTTDPNEGIRFSRQSDGDMTLIAQGYSLSFCRATEHGWE